MTVTPRGGEPERFDEVVLATHSDQALRMLADASDREHEILGAIPYQPNEAVLHTDRALLPRRRRAWASWNYHLLPEPTGMTTVTYHMNRLQALDADREFCVTLNRSEAIDPAKILRTISYAHPVFTADGRPRAGPPRRDQRAQPHALLRRLLGLGLPRGRRRQRRARRRALRGAPVTGDVRGHDPPPPLRGARARASSYRIALAYVDVDAPPRGFRRSDYLGDAAVPLREAVHALIRERGGEPPDGPIRLLDDAALVRRRLQPGVASTTASAPTSGSSASSPRSRTRRGASATPTSCPARRRTPDKALHVSPFMGMDHDYEVRASVPGETLSVHIESRRDGRARLRRDAEPAPAAVQPPPRSPAPRCARSP